MKRSRSIVAFLLSVFATGGGAACAQEYEFGSALSQSVAGVVTLLPSSPSVMSSHPAVMAFAADQTSIELSYRQLYGLSELEDFAAQARFGYRALTGGLAANRFGEAGLYQEYTITGAGSWRIRRDLSVGTALKYRSAEFGDGQSRYAGGTLDLSAAYRAVPSLLFSGSIGGLTLDRLYDEDDTDPILEAGAAWSSRSEVAIGAIWTRRGPGDHRFALGQVLALGQNFDFLAGLRFDPVRYNLGGRVLLRGTSLIYTYSGHPDLGGTHAFGFQWSR